MKNEKNSISAATVATGTSRYQYISSISGVSVIVDSSIEC